MTERKPKQYRVLTYDWEKQQFTPQKGVKQGPYTRKELKAVKEKLRNLGYECSGDWYCDTDPSVMIEEW